jgi:dynein heavy chain
MIGNIVYGGRVTDQWDTRILNFTLKSFFNPSILQDGYYFMNSKFYVSPSRSTLLEYKRHIQNLPDNDEPEIFGLSLNSNLKY